MSVSGETRAAPKFASGYSLATLAGDDLKPLRCFLAVAEELSFTRAARRLGTSQSQLSRIVRRFENDLGVELLHRTSRNVWLTPAGVSLQAEGTATLIALERAYSHARRNGGKTSRHVRVGWSSGVAGVRSSKIFRAFAQQHPDITLELCQLPWSEQISAVTDGRVDLQFLRLPDVSLPGLRVEPLFEERRVAAMADNHPLASRASIALADIRLEPLITAASVPKSWADWWAVDPRPDGGSPVYALAVETAEEMSEHVAAGHGISITAASSAFFFRRDDVVYVPITDAEPFLVSLAWRDDGETTATQAFISVTRSVLLDRTVNGRST
ncbi:MAG TPA: LysR family transcriptional regulator [Solirubrobacteraceae bacterium]|nr:LysR family transcriptional regulator [Solirubrobacteraceae bacterium]